MSEFIDQWMDLARKTARFTASDFPDVEAGDIEGKLLVLLAEKNLFGSDPSTDGYAFMLQRAAARFAWEERKEHLQVTAQYAYRTKDVSMLLENLFDPAKWADATVPDDAKSFENSHGVDGIEMTSDMAWAYTHLPENYKRAIFYRYALNEVPERGSPAAKQLTRAKQRMAEILNYHHRPEAQGPGARKAVSNAQARYRLDSQ